MCVYVCACDCVGGCIVSGQKWFITPHTHDLLTTDRKSAYNQLIVRVKGRVRVGLGLG